MSDAPNTIAAHSAAGRGWWAFWIAVAIVLVLGVLRTVRPNTRNVAPFRGAQGSLTATTSPWLRLAGLDADTAARVSEAIGAHESNVSALQQRQQDVMQQVADRLTAPSFGAGALDAVRDDARALAVDAVDEMFAAVADVAATLTPAQRASLVERWERR